MGTLLTNAASASFARAILVAGGPLPRAQALLLQAEIVRAEQNKEAVKTALVGVDSGATHLLDLGTAPHFATGDFDSLSLAHCTALAARGTQLVSTPDQNYTDLDKALTFARETVGAREIQIWAATGGRIDHAYSVLSAVLKHGRGGGPNAPIIRLMDEWGETRPVSPEGVVLQGAALPGRVLSLITLGAVENITTTGVEWSLSGETLAPGVRDGTLNRITDERVSVSFGAGDLLLFIGH